MTKRQLLGVLILIVCALILFGYLYWVGGWVSVISALGLTAFCGVIVFGIHLIEPLK